MELLRHILSPYEPIAFLVGVCVCLVGILVVCKVAKALLPAIVMVAKVGLGVCVVLFVLLNGARWQEGLETIHVPEAIGWVQEVLYLQPADLELPPTENLTALIEGMLEEHDEKPNCNLTKMVSY